MFFLFFGAILTLLSIGKCNKQVLTMQNPMIAYHAKSELRGWNEVCRHPADWDGWHSFDRSMIQELLSNGSQVVTCGWNMYQLVSDSIQ